MAGGARTQRRARHRSGKPCQGRLKSHPLARVDAAALVDGERPATACERPTLPAHAQQRTFSSDARWTLRELRAATCAGSTEQRIDDERGKHPDADADTPEDQPPAEWQVRCARCRAVRSEVPV